MNEELRTAIDRLKALPEDDQQRFGAQINDYLNRLEDLRAAIREGFESGDAGEMDVEAIIREARAEFEARVAG
jgi:hypothetical protein